MYRDSEIGVIFHHGVLSRSALSVRVAQLVSFLFALVYGLLVARFLFVYVQASPSPFVLWVGKTTDVVYLPLRQLLADGRDPAGHPLAWSILLVIAACAVVQWSVVSWLREIARPKLQE
jgi:hypothetical protein